MSDLLSDLRFAFRTFRHSPLHAGLTVLILGVGIGAVTLMFSTMNASVLRPLPYPEPDRLVWLWKASDVVSQNSVSYDDFKDYRAGIDAFQEFGATQLFNPRPLLSGGDESQRVEANLVTPNLFDVLGVAPVIGRTFRWDEAVLGGPEVAILSYPLWQARFGGDADVLGSVIQLDGTPTEIVGVMPQGFEFRRPVDLWLPTRDGSGATTGRGNNNFFLVGRLKEGMTLEGAQAQVDAVAAQIQEANPDMANWFHWLQPLHEVFFGSARNILFLIFGIICLVPLLACANVASLSLARATARVTELATRLSLGAARGRIIRQLLVESFLLALAGGLLGLGLAYGGGVLLRSLGPATLPRLEEIGVDLPVLAFALLASVLTVPLFGVIPALRGTDFDLARALRFGGRGSGGGRNRLRSVLVVCQVALSMTLLIASGLLFRSFQTLQSVDPGFRVESLLTARIQLPDFRYPGPEELGLAWESTLDRIRAVPGVESVGAADWLPVTPGGGPWNSVYPQERPPEAGAQGTPASRKYASVDYFETVGAPMRSGRTFTRDDTPESPLVMILSEALAQTLYPEENPLGRMVMLWGAGFEVVGVAGPVAESGLGAEGRPAFYISAKQFPIPRLQLLVRTAGVDPLSLAPLLRRALGEIDPDISLSDMQTMETRISGTLAQPRFRTRLVGAFALAGLLLAAFGLYGILAFLVARRRHEIGIRMAVGARTGDVVCLVLKRGLALVGVGAAIGILGGGIASVFLRSLLFGVSPADPLTFLGSTLVLLIVASGASLLPAFRAARVDPLESFRAE
ncbi:MAG: ABC transporter permease [Gemmatimonadota bacterium]